MQYFQLLANKCLVAHQISMQMHSLGAEIDLKELYKRVEFSPRHPNLDRFHIGLAEKLD